MPILIHSRKYMSSDMEGIIRGSFNSKEGGSVVQNEIWEEGGCKESIIRSYTGLLKWKADLQICYSIIK